ncbi:MAG: hypothetical protein M1827_000733 [Pycnora praestabilis]|nr:MAG: hypothetical protein M1827_000733 [Pycnora praestabilis]
MPSTTQKWRDYFSIRINGLPPSPPPPPPPPPPPQETPQHVPDILRFTPQRSQHTLPEPRRPLVAGTLRPPRCHAASPPRHPDEVSELARAAAARSVGLTVLPPQGTTVQRRQQRERKPLPTTLRTQRVDKQAQEKRDLALKPLPPAPPAGRDILPPGARGYGDGRDTSAVRIGKTGDGTRPEPLTLKETYRALPPSDGEIIWNIYSSRRAKRAAAKQAAASSLPALPTLPPLPYANVKAEQPLSKRVRGEFVAQHRDETPSVGTLLLENWRERRREKRERKRVEMKKGISRPVLITGVSAVGPAPASTSCGTVQRGKQETIDEYDDVRRGRPPTGYIYEDDILPAPPPLPPPQQQQQQQQPVVVKSVPKHSVRVQQATSSTPDLTPMKSVRGKVTPAPIMTFTTTAAPPRLSLRGGNGKAPKTPKPTTTTTTRTEGGKTSTPTTTTTTITTRPKPNRGTRLTDFLRSPLTPRTPKESFSSDKTSRKGKDRATSPTGSDSDKSFCCIGVPQENLERKPPPVSPAKDQLAERGRGRGLCRACKKRPACDARGGGGGGGGLCKHSGAPPPPLLKNDNSTSSAPARYSPPFTNPHLQTPGEEKGKMTYPKWQAAILTAERDGWEDEEEDGTKVRPKQGKTIPPWLPSSSSSSSSASSSSSSSWSSSDGSRAHASTLPKTPAGPLPPLVRRPERDPPYARRRDLRKNNNKGKGETSRPSNRRSSFYAFYDEVLRTPRRPGRECTPKCNWI